LSILDVKVEERVVLSKPSTFLLVGEHSCFMVMEGESKLIDDLLVFMQLRKWFIITQ
jgi:hypothetical protein